MLFFKRISNPLLLAFSFLMCAQTHAGTVRFVATTGSDCNSGTV